MSKTFVNSLDGDIKVIGVAPQFHIFAIQLQAFIRQGKTAPTYLGFVQRRFVLDGGYEFNAILLKEAQTITDRSSEFCLREFGF